MTFPNGKHGSDIIVIGDLLRWKYEDGEKSKGGLIVIGDLTK